jgi:hypothetical protein
MPGFHDGQSCKATDDCENDIQFTRTTFRIDFSLAKQGIKGKKYGENTDNSVENSEWRQVIRHDVMF